jgi:hypothetical protein
MNQPFKSDDPDDWQPATAAPGELYSPAGEMRARWAVLSGLKHRDPRGAGYRRSMRRVAGVAVLVGVALIVAIAVFNSATN